MLQIMRELSKSWIFKSLMGLLIVSFGIWGIGDMFRGNPAQRTVASVGDITIPVQSLEFRFQADLPEARSALGPDLTADQARQIGVLDRTLNVMIEEFAYDQDATRQGISVAPDYIMKKLASEPSLRDKDGKFNVQLWQHLLGKTGLSEQSFLDHETKGTARQLILASLIANTEPPKTMVDNLYQARGDKRLVEIVTLRNDSLKNSVDKPKDEEIEAYYKANEAKFVAPDYRGITIGKITAESIGKDVKIEEADVRQAYESRSGELVLPETRDLVQIIMQDEAKARALADAAQAAKSLTDAAKAKGLTPITMNKIDDKTILPELYTTIFALEAGQISAPVKSSMGWHVVQVKTIHAGGLPSYEEIVDKLTTTLRDERAGDLVAKTINQLDDALAGGQALEDIADELKMHLTRTAAVDAQGNAPDGKPVADIPAKDLTLRAAFELGSGETGQVLEDGLGSYYVVRVDQITPSQTRPLADVRPAVITAWTTDQLELKAAASAEALAQSLREGKTATSFASRPGVEIRLSKPLSLLGDTDKDIPANAAQQIFRMKKGDVTTAAVPGKQYVLRLSDIVPVDPAKPEASRIKVLEDLKEKLPRVFVDAYSDYLHGVFPVKINEELVEQLKFRDQDGNR